jgi:hypothetical protein
LFSDLLPPYLGFAQAKTNGGFLHGGVNFVDSTPAIFINRNKKLPNKNLIFRHIVLK